MNKVRQAVECLKGNLWDNVTNAGINPLLVKSLRYGIRGYYLSPYSLEEDGTKQGVQLYICTVEEFEKESLEWRKDRSFSKTQLISGEHVVEFPSGKRYLVLNNHLLSENDAIDLSIFEDDLTSPTTNSGVLFIKRVLTLRKQQSLKLGYGFKGILVDPTLELVWERQVNTK